MPGTEPRTLRRGVTATAVVVLVTALLLAGCAPEANDAATTAPAGHDDPAGFWLGIWHGWIIAITFVVSLFNQDVGIYEAHNSGWPYNLGYLIGLFSYTSAAAVRGRRQALGRRWGAYKPRYEG